MAIVSIKKGDRVRVISGEVLEESIKDFQQELKIDPEARHLRLDLQSLLLFEVGMILTIAEDEDPEDAGNLLCVVDPYDGSNLIDIYSRMVELVTE